MADRKDEIISLQLDLIRKMTENNIRRLSDDIWGPQRKKANKENSINDNVDADFAAMSTEKDDNKSGNDKTKSTGSTGSSSDDEKDSEVAPKENIDDLLAELDSYIGLGEVKKEVRSLINMAKVYKLRRDNDLPTADMSLHMVFSGNPGTGKTMTASIIAVIMTQTESKDLLLDFLKSKPMVISHAKEFFGFLILCSRDMNRTVVMLSKTSCNDFSISLISFYTLPAALFEHGCRSKNYAFDIACSKLMI